ncbi:MAG: methyltransferase [Cellvibrionales bacterium]|nr:methyltransferase [Cellvibrionales bacterium]
MTVLDNDKPHTELRISHGVAALTSSHPEVRRLKRQSEAPAIHGNKVWSSSYAIMQYLNDNPLPKNQSVLDVGCGFGTLSCYFQNKQQSRVLATDADPYVEPFFDLTCEINETSIPFRAMKIEKMTKQFLSDFDVLVGADICFWDEMTELLFKLINRATQVGVKQIYIADPGRQPFWDLADLAADKFYGTVKSIKTGKTKQSEKYILSINNS